MAWTSVEETDASCRAKPSPTRVIAAARSGSPVCAASARYAEADASSVKVKSAVISTKRAHAAATDSDEPADDDDTGDEGAAEDD